MKSELTDRQLWIYAYISSKHGEFVSPTEIGMAYGDYIHQGKPHHCHSALASPVCKQLVELGWISRNKRGWYSSTI